MDNELEFDIVDMVACELQISFEEAEELLQDERGCSYNRDIWLSGKLIYNLLLAAKEQFTEY